MACGPRCWVVFFCTWTYAVGFKSKTANQAVEVTNLWYRRLAHNFTEHSYGHLESEVDIGSHPSRVEASYNAELAVSRFATSTLEEIKNPGEAALVKAGVAPTIAKQPEKKTKYRSLEQFVDGVRARHGIDLWPHFDPKTVRLADMTVAAFLGQRLDVQSPGHLEASAISSSRAMKMFDVWADIHELPGARLLFLGGDPAGVNLCEAEAAKVVLSFNTLLRVHDGKARIDPDAIRHPGRTIELHYGNDSFTREWKGLDKKKRKDLLDVFGGREAAQAWATGKKFESEGDECDAEELQFLKFLEGNYLDAREERRQAVEKAALFREPAQKEAAKASVKKENKADDARSQYKTDGKWNFLRPNNEWTSDFNTDLSDLISYQGVDEDKADTILQVIRRSQDAQAYFDLRSRLTLTNAVEMVKLGLGVLAPRPIRATIILVSNSFHLPRAKYIFQAVLATGKAIWVEEDGWRFDGEKYKPYIEMYQLVVQDGDPRIAAQSGHNMAQLGSDRQLRAFFWALHWSDITFELADCGFKAVEGGSRIPRIIGAQLIQGKGIVRIPEQHPYVTGSNNEKVQVNGLEYPLARFFEGSFEFNGDFCRLNPDIFKASSFFNRIETINWNLAMLIPRAAAYLWCMHDSFIALWGEGAVETSWVDDENSAKGGIPKPEGSLAFLATAAERYIQLAAEYYGEGERLSLPEEHEGHILCPQLEAYIVEVLCAAAELEEGGPKLLELYETIADKHGAGGPALLKYKEARAA